MEELNKTSLKLAIWNLGLNALVLIIMLIFISGPDPALNHSDIKAFTVWMCVMYAVLLPIVYYLWFKFIRNLKDAYCVSLKKSLYFQQKIMILFYFSIHSC